MCHSAVHLSHWNLSVSTDSNTHTHTHILKHSPLLEIWSLSIAWHGINGLRSCHLPINYDSVYWWDAIDTGQSGKLIGNYQKLQTRWSIDGQTWMVARPNKKCSTMWSYSVLQFTIPCFEIGNEPLRTMVKNFSTKKRGEKWMEWRIKDWHKVITTNFVYRQKWAK